MGITNKKVTNHMNALFEEERADELREEMKALTPDKRELMIIERISEGLQEMGGEYVLPFYFRNEQGTRTKHYLIFVSKNVTAYTIMKGIMGGESSKHEQGVPSFSYCEADKSMPLLFDLARPLDDLEELLLNNFSGKTLTMKQIFDQHHVGSRICPRIIKRRLHHWRKKARLKLILM
jgi:hypothetical protein